MRHIRNQTATQAAIEKTLQAIAVLDEAGKSLEKGLAAAADDADLKQSFAALGTARQAKQGQLKQQQDALATMMTEKGQWDQAFAAEKASMEKQRAKHADKYAKGKYKKGKGKWSSSVPLLLPDPSDRFPAARSVAHATASGTDT